MLFDAFDLGITHFDLANNYGPPPGAAEQRVGKIIKDMPRDELIIASKAGWPMWLLHTRPWCVLPNRVLHKNFDRHNSKWL